MTTILKKLTNDIWSRKNEIHYEQIKKGNYIIEKDRQFIIHRYYGNIICSVNLKSKTFILNSCGYLGYRLTTAQLNFLEKFYKEKGLKLSFRK